MPEVLYHYTNIESLALILKNRIIRLNSLNKMDDLEENLSSDIKNIGMFTYVSSWTDQERESIALWKQYTNHDTGVRIELEQNPFKKYSVKDMVSEQELNNIFGGNDDIKSIIQLDKMFQSNYFTQVVTGDDILYKVEYPEDENKIIPRLISNDSEKQIVSISLGMVGKYKRYDWNYQCEWRYIIQFLPGNILKVFSDGGMTFKSVFIDIANGRAKQPFSYYDLEIDDNAFANMKVVLSPTISLGNEILIRTAIEMFNPSVKISESAFKGKIG